MREEVRVYTTGESCIRCKLTKKALTAKGIEFVEVDVTLAENAAAHAYITDELGYTEAPVVVVDDEDHWSGFRPDHIDRLAAHH
ncbi:glutaredoxin family protein [Pseudoclavibacter helvolus]|uniref:Glutaredoxin-like protein NrdH n=1 Tax=Pseudoclavibacter helvolus TaxID=255205 RepID=A0A7W4UT78_9MICO|nr:glutaredoxin-like protein NrdH [Pseudoclavibacter helvolus]